MNYLDFSSYRFTCKAFYVLLFILVSPNLLAQAPTTGATNFSANNIVGNGMRVNWTRGNGSRVLVVASASPTFGGTGIPADGTDYTANATFGSGNQIGVDNFVVYKGTGASVTTTGLTNSTIYYFRIYEFNGTGSGTQYNTINVLSGDGTTLFPPTIGSSNMSATPAGNSASLTWTRGDGTRSLIILQVGSAPNDPTQYTNYTANANFGSGTAIGTGRVVFLNSTNTVNVTNLQPNTQYFYKVVEANGPSNPVFDLVNTLVGSFTTGGAPTTGASNFSVTNIVGNGLRVNWTRGNGSNVLVLASLSPTFNGTGIPANGTDYVANATFGSGDQIGAGNFVVYRGTGANVTITGMVNSTIYHFRLFEFNGINFNTVFNTTDVLAGTGTTLFPPTVGSTNLIATPTGNTASLTWTRGNGTRSLVILQAGSATSDPIQYTNYLASANFGSGSAVGSGRVVYFNSSNLVNVTNLQPNTQYFYRVVESNGPSSPVYDLTNVLVGSFTTVGAPTIGSTALTTSNIQGNRFSISFSPGNGTERLVVARQDNPVIWTPTDGVEYNVSSVFGVGDNLGNNTFAVGKLTNSSLAITGLTPATTYHFAIFEFNGNASNTFYLTTPAQVLTGQETTLSPPSVSAGNFSFTNITGYNATVSYTAGNGSGRIVLVQAGSPVTDVPVSLVDYTGNPNFSTAPILGSSKIVADGSSVSFTLQSLQPNTTYHFAVFEYNGSSGPVYKQADPGIGSFTTLGKPTVSPTSLTFSNIEGNRMTLNYTTGNGFGRIVIGKQGSPVDIFPTDLTSYTANSTFGNAAAHLGGGNYVLENDPDIGGNSITSVTGLSVEQTYHFAIIEYNGTGTNRIYMTSAEALTGSSSTLSPPTQQATNLTFSNITSNTLTVSWINGNGNGRIVLIRQGQAVQSLPVNLSNYIANSNYPSSPALGTSKVVYDNTGNSVNIVNIPPGEYHFAVVEYNGSSGPVYRTSDPLIGSVNVGDKPIVPATNLSFSNVQGNSMRLTFTQGDGISRMIIAKQGSPVDTWPADFTGYTADNNFGSGSDLGGGNFVVGSGGGNDFIISNLQPATLYHFAIVEFNGSGANAFYQLPAIVATTSNSTLTAPTVNTSNFFANNITGNRMQVTWTRGNGTGRLIVAKAGSPVDVVPANLTNPNTISIFGSGANLGNGNFAMYDGGGDNFTISNLEPDANYHFASFEFNGAGSGKVYLTDNVGGASFTTAPGPSVAAKNLNVSSVNGDRFTLSFTEGNGTRRLVVLRKGGLVNELPLNLTTYTGGNFGAGTDLGNGNFVVAFGPLTSTFVVAGLEPDTQYGVAVFEVDGSNGNQRYLVSQYINQLVSTAAAPTIPTSSLLFNSIGSTSVNLSWTNGNGAGRMVALLPSQPVTFQPTVLSTHGSSSANFASATNNLPLGHKHIYRGAATTVTITNLLPGTTYHLAFFEYNGTGQPVYNYIPLTGFFTTLPASGIAIGGFDAITFCPLQQVDVPYVFTGLLNAGNILSVELSDITGSFASPTVLGTQSTTNASGFITSTLPASLPEGIGYRLRVRATNPTSLSADNGADLQITTSVQPTYTVVGSITSSCGTPIQLTTSQPNYNLQWFRNGTPIAGATTSSHIATLTGDYQVRISGASGGCQLLSTATTLTITQEPAFNFLFDPAYCIDEIIDLKPLTQPTGGVLSGPGIVNGVFNAASAGIGQHLIDYTYIDAVSLCSFSKTTQILVTALPGTPTTLAGSGCQLTGISLVAMGANVTESYQWYSVAVGGTPIAGATLPTFTTPPLTATTSYYVSIVSAAGCEGPRTEAIATVTTVAKPTITSTGSTSFCGSGSVMLNAPAGFTSYEWSTGETTQSITVTTADDYTVLVRDAGGCESENSNPVTVIINQPPQTPQITVEGNLAICPGQAATLSAPAGFTYLWSTGATTPDLVVTTPDTYSVIVTDANGCTATSQAIATTLGVCEIIIYNGISPNGDLKNESWIIENISSNPETENNTVTIYNRWGSKVWEGKNYDNDQVKFVGETDSGKELPSGTYFYKIEFNSGRKSENGYLTLKK